MSILGRSDSESWLVRNHQNEERPREVHRPPASNAKGAKWRAAQSRTGWAAHSSAPSALQQFSTTFTWGVAPGCYISRRWRSLVCLLLFTFHAPRHGRAPAMNASQILSLRASTSPFTFASVRRLFTNDCHLGAGGYGSFVLSRRLPTQGRSRIFPLVPNVASHIGDEYIQATVSPGNGSNLLPA